MFNVVTVFFNVLARKALPKTAYDCCSLFLETTKDVTGILCEVRGLIDSRITNMFMGCQRAL